MAITRKHKEQLISQYITDLQGASNAVVVQQKGLSVDDATSLRRAVREADGKSNVVRKRLFLRAIKDAGLQEISPDNVDGSIMVFYAHDDEYGPLKAINTFVKKFKKNEETSLVFLGGWFDKEWKDQEHVVELANLPTRDELIGKLLFLFKYPVQSLTSVLDQIAEKKNDAGEKQEEQPAEAETASTETKEVKEETKEEEKTEEVKQDEKQSS